MTKKIRLLHFVAVNPVASSDWQNIHTLCIFLQSEHVITKALLGVQKILNKDPTHCPTYLFVTGYHGAGCDT